MNEQFEEALRLLNTTRRNLFITGRAGTGKSTLLKHFRNNTEKQAVVLAPTGVSALNVKGQTIHSFFGFAPNIRPDQVGKEKPTKALMDILIHLDVMIIDEVSMVRADLMDCIDQALRTFLETSEPFGGVQMVFIGDLHQLPPVLTRDEKAEFMSQYPSPYFFDAKVFQESHFDTLELMQVYRQSDKNFVQLLNKVRSNQATHWDLEALNARVMKDPDGFHDKDHSYITLTTTNKAADEINAKRLERLSSGLEHYEAEVSGEFTNRSHPTKADLKLKRGAQVMMLNNDMEGRWVNGSIGKIEKITFDGATCEDVLHVRLEGKKNTVEVRPYKWELHKYSWDDEKGEMKQDTVGSFRQYPMRLAWAITIHKSQGKTFDKVVVDVGRGTFAHGQLYVALSRCRSMQGLLLHKPIQARHIWSNRRIDSFYS